MAEIKDIVAYFCKNYPHKKELSKARLTKMVYLADWESVLKDAQQVTKIEWFFNHYGPYVDDVIDEVYNNQDIFDLENVSKIYGSDKGMILLKDESYEPLLTDKEKSILDKVIDDTKTLYWDKFTDYVYNTLPVKKSKRYDKMDLKNCA